MKYGSVCSGVEAATLAWMPLGWECKFVSEVEPFPCAVLQERFGASAPINPLDPAEASDDADRKMRESWIKQNEYLKKEGVLPNEGDFTKIGKKYAGKIDLLVGGTPCQDLSIAGKRAGFEGERSSLALDFVRLAYESKCKWFVWENVPGVFSSNNGRDFATLLSLFTGSKVEVPKDGWGTAGFVCNARRDRFGVAWRTLDGQFTRTKSFPFAVPQRRRRVFLVGYFGDWTRAAQVLLEPSRLQWNNPPRIKTRKEIAEIVGTNAYLATRTLQSDKADGGIGITVDCDVYNSSLTGDVSKTLNSAATDADHVPTVISAYNGAEEESGEITPTLQASLGKLVNNQNPIICLNDQGGSVMSVEDDGNAGILRANTHGNEQIVCGAFLGQMGAKAHGIGYEEEIAPTVNTGQLVDLVQTLKIRSGKEGGGKGALVQDELSATQGCGNDQTLFVVHGAQTPINNDEEYADPLGCCNDGLENVISMHNKQFGQCEENIASTLLSSDYKEPQVVCYENHANDSRITESNEVCPLISSRAGTGGGNLPLVQECYAIDSVHSNAMKSSNPHSGFHKEEIAKTLDTTVPNPTKNQGGNVIVSYDCYNQTDCGDIARTLSTEHHGTNLNVIASSINCQGESNINVNNDITETLTAATNSSGNNLLGDNQTATCFVVDLQGGKSNSRCDENVSPTLLKMHGFDVHAACIAIDGDKIGKAERKGGSGMGVSEKDVMYTQTAKDVHAICTNGINSTVRRLLPIECERLMGFPDNWTRIPWKGKSAEECPDSPRYKACGNSMCVNVMQWLGEQIQMVEDSVCE